MATHIGRERKPVTVLFADVVDSTAMAERMDPEDWATTMNKAFDLMAQAVKKYEGTVAQFLGDGILAFFGAPLAHEDDPHRAVWAALQMLEETSKLATELKGSANLNLRIRIGINTGPAILGNVGNLESGAYSAMGDTLNTAARVQSAAEPSTVALTEGTFRLVAAAFESEDLGEIEVKGKAAPMHLYRVTGPRTVDPTTDSSGALSSPIVGREAQMAHLRRLVSAVGKGRGGVAFVIGEPGIGKSRLIREIKSSVFSHHPDLIWLEGRPLSYGSSVPYRLVLQIVRSLFGTGLATDPHEAAEVVRRVLEDFIGPGAAEALPYIAHLLSIPVAGAALPEDMEPEVLQQRYVDSLTSLFNAAANQQPIVIACDDLHWADASSAALLSKLLKIASHSRVLFIFSSRREPQSAGWRLLTEARDSFGEALTEINLGPFSPAESAALAEQLLGRSPPDSLRNFVYEVTEGNPLFIEEVVRSYVCPDPSGAEWNARTRESLLESSSSLHRLLLASIDRLPEQAKRVLKVASVIGREFAVDVLEQVVHETDESLDVARQVSALEASGVIRISEVQSELQYSFRHSLLQEAAYGSLLKSERRKLHAAIGAALENVYPERTEELAGLLARHFEEAGEDERALSYSVLAADAAFSRYATSEAAIHYARAVDIATRSGGHHDRLSYLHLRLGRALELTGRYDEAIGAYQRLEELGRTRGARDLQLAGLVAGATALVTPSSKQDIPKAERLAGRALELARQTGDRAAEGMSLWNLMLAHNFSGRDPALAIKFGEDALAIARQVGSTEQVASTLLDLHWAYLGNGQIDRSAQALDEAAALWVQLGDKVMLADSLAGSSGLKLFVGDFQGVIAVAEQARSISEEAGTLWGQMSSRAYLGYAYLELGRPAEAIDVMRQCVRMAEEIHLAGLPGIRADLGLTLAQTGSFDEGLALAQRAWEESLQGSEASRGWVAARLAKIHLLMAKVDDAASLLQSIDPETDAGLSMPIPVKYPLRLVTAELALAKGDWEPGLSLSRTLAEELARLNFKFWLPEALLLQARASSALGEYNEAIRVLEKGQAVAVAMGATWSLRPIAALLNELNKMSKH